MKSLLLSFLLAAAASAAPNPFAGRWDITVKAPNSTYPGWIEVVDAADGPQVRYQPRGGSVRPLKDSKIENSHLILIVAPGGKNGPTTWDLTVSADSLTGVMKAGARETAQLTGVRAPALDRKAPKKWSKPEPLFNGKDLTGWEPTDPKNNHWVAKDGDLLNESKGANLKTTRKFDDFKVHIELNCPLDGNSGVYLRGRYEMQVEYETSKEDDYHCMGAIYGMVPVSPRVEGKPGAWESFDITFVGRKVTIERNGVKIIDNKEIAGITGGALDSNEGEPGPFYIQGDHTGGMRYRNILISVPKK